MKERHEPCAACGGATTSKRLDLDRHIYGKWVLFEDVPAHVCVDCGEVWLDAAVLRAMESAVADGRTPSRQVEIPSFSLASLRAA